MRCDKAQELFSDYCEGTVQNALIVPLESHLSTCADCRSQVEDLGRIWKMLDEAPVVDPPADFRANVWRRIDATQSERAPRVWFPRLSFDWRSLFARPTLGWAAAALLVVVLAGIAVPGRYTAARMMFPWNMFYHTTQHVPQTWSITAGDPHIEIVEGRRVVVVPLASDASTPLDVKVQVGGEAAMRTEEQAISLSVRQPSELRVPLATGTASSSLTLQVHWLQNGQERSQRITVAIPQ